MSTNTRTRCQEWMPRMESKNGPQEWRTRMDDEVYTKETLHPLKYIDSEQRDNLHTKSKTFLG